MKKDELLIKLLSLKRIGSKIKQSSYTVSILDKNINVEYLDAKSLQQLIDLYKEVVLDLEPLLVDIMYLKDKGEI